jgi:hypothetical protein
MVGTEGSGKNVGMSYGGRVWRWDDDVKHEGHEDGTTKSTKRLMGIEGAGVEVASGKGGILFYMEGSEMAQPRTIQEMTMEMKERMTARSSWLRLEKRKGWRVIFGGGDEVEDEGGDGGENADGDGAGDEGDDAEDE